MYSFLNKFIIIIIRCGNGDRMKNTMMMMVGAAAGIGIYMGVEKMTKNKKVIKRKLNTIIDDTADLIS